MAAMPRNAVIGAEKLSARCASRDRATPEFGAAGIAGATNNGARFVEVEGRENTFQLSSAAQSRPHNSEFTAHVLVWKKPLRRLAEIKNLQTQKTTLSHCTIRRMFRG